MAMRPRRSRRRTALRRPLLRKPVRRLSVTQRKREQRRVPRLATAGRRKPPPHVRRRARLHPRGARKTRGQQKIDPERAKSIQEALIREHYLTGEPSGTWNQTSEEAMRRYQGDHGWQTKEVPDSRALIKLGLGPSNDHLLNPESAMTSSPESPAAGKPAVRPASAVPEDPKRR